MPVPPTHQTDVIQPMRRDVAGAVQGIVVETPRRVPHMVLVRPAPLQRKGVHGQLLQVAQGHYGEQAITVMTIGEGSVPCITQAMGGKTTVNTIIADIRDKIAFGCAIGRHTRLPARTSVITKYSFPAHPELTPRHVM